MVKETENIYDFFQYGSFLDFVAIQENMFSFCFSPVLSANLEISLSLSMDCSRAGHSWEWKVASSET